MLSSSFFRRGLSFWILATAPSVAQRYLEVPWSDKRYGPDGPWQAVKITVGGNDTSLKIGAQNHADLDVYPGGAFETFTFGPSACDPYPDSPCGDGGTWEPDVGATGTIAWRPTVEEPSFGLLAGPINYTARALTIGCTTVWNVSIQHTNNVSITAFDGKTTGMRLGYLGLGAQDKVQTFTANDYVAGHDLSYNLYSGKLYADGMISSYSYLLHVGSAAFDYPGSLVFGGYNKGRVIGPPTSFRDPQVVDLLDIGIGVEHGESPFEIDNMQNLLVADAGETGVAQKVRIDPRSPYLSLPDNTCEGLAKVLPIAYDATTRYYLWKTDDSAYEKIVTSPAYLSFTFPPGSGASLNVTIEVPFALLNLTLDVPVVDKPTPYFPCHAYTRDPDNEEDHDKLGRAFLQAAYLDRNWASQMTWLGQAPGPGATGQGLGDQLLEIADGATTLEYWDSEETNYFNQSWTGHWSVIDSAKPKSPPNDTDINTSGYLRGTKAGIGVGAAAAGLALFVIGILLWRRRKQGDKVAPSDFVHPPEQHLYGSLMPPEYGQSEKEKNGMLPETQEMHTVPEPQELPATSEPRPK